MAEASGTNQIAPMGTVVGLINRLESNETLILSSPRLLTTSTLARSHGNRSEELFTLYVVLYGGIVPLITLIGLAANVTNIAVLAYVMRRYKTAVYRVLLSIAVVDLLLMGVLFIYCARFFMRAHPIVYNYEADGIDTPSYFFFHTWDTFANICGVASNWYVMLVMILRLVNIYSPSKASNSLLGRTTINILLPAILVFAVALNLPWALVNSYDSELGTFVLLKDTHNDYKRSYYVVLLVLYHVLPWMAVSILAGFLLFGIWSQRGTLRSSGVAGTAFEQRKRKMQRMLSVTLTGKACWFVASTAPTVVYHFILFASDDDELAYFPTMEKFHLFSRALLLTNYAANFFLYAFLNHTYRDRLRGLFCCRPVAESPINSDDGDGSEAKTADWSTALAAEADRCVELHPL